MENQKTIIAADSIEFLNMIQELELQTVKTNTGEVVVGFEDFDAAQDFARKTGADIVRISRRDGEHTWRNEGWTNEPYTLSSDDFGDDYRTETDAAEYWRAMRERFNETEFKEPTDAIEYLQKIEEIYNAILDLDENEQVLTCCTSWDYEVIKIKTMSFHEDVWSYKVGVAVVK